MFQHHNLLVFLTKKASIRGIRGDSKLQIMTTETRPEREVKKKKDDAKRGTGKVKLMN